MTPPELSRPAGQPQTRAAAQTEPEPLDQLAMASQVPLGAASTNDGDAIYRRVLAMLDAQDIPAPPLAERSPGDSTAVASLSPTIEVHAGPAGQGAVAEESASTEAAGPGAIRRSRQRTRSAQAAAALCCVCCAVLWWPSPQVAPASHAVSAPSPPGLADTLSARAQATLDRVLGAGHSVVTVTAVYADASQQTSVQYDAKNVASVVGSGPAGPYRSVSGITDNAVGRTTTTLVVPGGQIQRLSVAVIVDSSLRPPPAVAAVRAWMAAAVGLRPGRGDQITVLSLQITAPARAATAGRQSTPAPSRYLPSGLAVTGGVLLVSRLVRFRRPRRRAATLVAGADAASRVSTNRL